MLTETLPCPFCGKVPHLRPAMKREGVAHDDEMDLIHPGWEQGFNGECILKGNLIAWSTGDCGASAVKKWNTRTKTQPVEGAKRFYTTRDNLSEKLGKSSGLYINKELPPDSEIDSDDPNDNALKEWVAVDVIVSPFTEVEQAWVDMSPRQRFALSALGINGPKQLASARALIDGAKSWLNDLAKVATTIQDAAEQVLIAADAITSEGEAQ